MARTRCTVREPHRLLPRQPRQPAAFLELEGADLEAHEASAAAVARQRSLQDRCAAAASACATFTLLAGLEVLPRTILLRIFEAVPADTRLRSCVVARSWAAFLAAPCAWRTLDLSPAGGVPRDAVCGALLRAAAARACGTLHTLDVSDCFWRLGLEERNEKSDDDRCSDTDEAEADEAQAQAQADDEDEADEVCDDEDCVPRRWLPHRAVLAVLAANSATLRVVRAHCARSLCDSAVAAGLRPPQLQLLLRAAPALAELHADVACAPAQAPALLCGADGWAPLRVRRLALCGIFTETTLADASPADMVATPELLTLVGKHASLCELELDRVVLDGDAAAAALAAAPGLQGLSLRSGVLRTGCTGCLPAEQLAALLRRPGPPLRALRLGARDATQPLAAAELAEQLRGARLAELCLDCGWGPWESAAVTAALLGGLAGHPTLRCLWLRNLSEGMLAPAKEEEEGVHWLNRVPREPSRHVWPLLGELLADAPALEALHVSGFAFYPLRDDPAGAVDAALAALARAAAGAPRLRRLEVPAKGLRQLEPAHVRAAAPELQALVLLHHFVPKWVHPMPRVRSTQVPRSTRPPRNRGAPERWVPEVDLLNDAAVRAWRRAWRRRMHIYDEEDDDEDEDEDEPEHDD